MQASMFWLHSFAFTSFLLHKWRHSIVRYFEPSFFNHASIPCTLCHTINPPFVWRQLCLLFFWYTIVQVFLRMYMWSVLYNKSWLLMMHGLTLKSFCWHLLISHHLLLHLAIIFYHRHTMQRQTMNLFFVWQNKNCFDLDCWFIHSRLLRCCTARGLL